MADFEVSMKLLGQPFCYCDNIRACEDLYSQERLVKLFMPVNCEDKFLAINILHMTLMLGEFFYF